MVSVISYTPPWLSRPSPGFDVFSFGSSKKRANGSETSALPGPNRTIAARGSEIFVATGSEIRWSDLVFLKERWESPDNEQVQRNARDEEDEEADSIPKEAELPSSTFYRVLKVPISRQIQQLSISPRGDYMAILTSHTVHIAILPDSSHLNSGDTNPLRLKTFQLGPTAHVLDQAPIASALWHPLGVLGSCLITVTVDAVVRLWELDRRNRWSFDDPALALDLRKLIDCVSVDDDFTASKYGTNKGYSPDSLELEVSGACFGGRDYDGENGWASMTLWVAMKEGDIYALCPLLPSKWQPSPFLIPTLSTSIVENVTCADDSEDHSTEASRTRSQQYKWISEIDDQDPFQFEDISTYSQVETYKRPVQPSAVPRLQGPFVPEPYPDGEFTITDIFALAGSSERVDLDSDDETVLTPKREKCPMNVICLATSDNKVHICLDLDGIEGQWLSSKAKTAQVLEDEALSLLLVETIDLRRSSDATQVSWSTFTPEAQSSSSVFVTHGSGVSHLSFDSWTQGLEHELDSTANSGVAFRIGTIVESIKTKVEQPIQLPNSQLHQQQAPIPTVLALEDSDLGYFLLTTNHSGQPLATTLSAPSFPLIPPPLLTHVTLPTPEPRPTYQPPSEFYASSTLPHFLDRHLQGRARPLRALQDPLRMSPATLELMMEAHRVLTHETHTLGAAAAELFRRCERLRDELREQVQRVDGVAVRVDAIVGDDIDFGDDRNHDSDNAGSNDYGESGAAETPSEELIPSAAAQKRLEKCRARHIALIERYDKLRRKLGRATDGRTLNRREEEWVREVALMKASVLVESGKTAERFREVEELKQELVDSRKDEETDGDDSTKRASSAAAHQPASNEIKRAIAVEIQAMLERESALVDATLSKLDRLRVAF